LSNDTLKLPGTDRGGSEPSRYQLFWHHHNLYEIVPEWLTNKYVNIIYIGLRITFPASDLGRQGVIRNTAPAGGFGEIAARIFYYCVGLSCGGRS
jgi:hypothetical protein